MEENNNINPTEVIPTSNQPETPTTANDNAPKKSNNLLIIATFTVACAALVISIIGLFSKGSEEPQTPAKAGKIVQTGNLKIAYINTDTIMAKYNMAVEMQKELSARQSQLETSLRNKYNQLQKEEQEYLKTGQNLTLSQQQAKEKDFKQREQQLSQDMQQQPAQFQQEIAKQNEKLLNAVLAFVKDYNAKHDKYNIILSTSRYNGPTLYIDAGMDITDEIVKGLNEEYDQVKKNK